MRRNSIRVSSPSFVFSLLPKQWALPSASKSRVLGVVDDCYKVFQERDPFFFFFLSERKRTDSN